MVLDDDTTRDIAAIASIDVVPTILDVICRTTGMGFAAIARVTDDRWIACSVRDEIAFGLEPGGELKLETTICHEIRQSGEAVIIDHVAEDPVFRDHKTPALYAFQSYISVPIVLSDGAFFGTLCAIDPRPAKLKTPETIGTFKLFAQLIAFHLAAIRQAVAKEAEIARERLALTTAVEERTLERDRLWELSEDLLVIADYEGGVLRASPSWTRALGYSEAALLAHDYNQITHPDDVPGAMDRVVAMRANGQPVSFENRIRSVDGAWRRIAWTLSPEPGGSQFTGVGRDITEKSTIEDALRQSQKMEAVGQLTGGVAHDFNNLLTIIRSSVDLLRRPGLAPERKQRYLDAVSDTVDRAATLTSQLLAFARRQSLKPKVFEVSERLEAVAEMLDTVTGTRIHLVTETPGRPCYVNADVSQFETALVNMAVNARDAMQGEGILTLRLACDSGMPMIRGHRASSEPFVAVSLTDTGAGIPPEAMGHIFEPFFTTKVVGKGTGLGLSQVFGFAKQSGGDVDVHSELGRGTTFTLYLPAVEADDMPVAVEAIRAASTGAGYRVLIVEDNMEVGRFATQILEDVGFSTAWAGNAEEALSKLEEGETFDIVFSDIVMPGMGGLELAKLLRVQRPDLPVVLASGYSPVLSQENDHGFDLLHKPYSVEELSRVLRRAVDVKAIGLGDRGSGSRM